MVEIAMNGPAKNALGSGMMDFIRRELERARGAPVLLTGTGDVFSAGLNLKELAALDAREVETFLRRLEAVYAALFAYPAPTAAAVNGHAIAGGCVLAMACDSRVCARDAKIRIGLNEVALGLPFPPGIVRMTRMLLPPQHVAEALLGARLYSPEEAVRLGFVDELADDPLAVARERLAALSRHPAEGYAGVKRGLRGTTFQQPDDEQAFQQILPAWTSPALKERIAAIFRK
jgi:enoyl-CoA hydratase/carnithine racemase